jgi:glutaredoxin
MYGTDYCPVSGQARKYMQQRGIEFEERNIDADEDALARRDEINPLHSTPTFEIDGRVVVGFSEQSLEEAIDEAAAKRVKKKRR